MLRAPIRFGVRHCLILMTTSAVVIAVVVNVGIIQTALCGVAIVCIALVVKRVRVRKFAQAAAIMLGGVVSCGLMVPAIPASKSYRSYISICGDCGAQRFVHSRRSKAASRYKPTNTSIDDTPLSRWWREHFGECNHSWWPQYRTTRDMVSFFGIEWSAASRVSTYSGSDIKAELDLTALDALYRVDSAACRIQIRNQLKSQIKWS